MLFPLTYGQALRAARKQCNLTLQQVSEAIGSERSQLSFVELDHRAPTDDFHREIVAFYSARGIDTSLFGMMHKEAHDKIVLSDLSTKTAKTILAITCGNLPADTLQQIYKLAGTENETANKPSNNDSQQKHHHHTLQAAWWRTDGVHA